MILSLQAFQRNLPKVMVIAPLGLLGDVAIALGSGALGKELEGGQRWAWGCRTHSERRDPGPLKPCPRLCGRSTPPASLVSWHG